MNLTENGWIKSNIWERWMIFAPFSNVNKAYKMCWTEDTKFSKHLINEHEPIMAALKRLNEQGHAEQFMIVVNTSGS